ncbi:MAG: hypothetical protein ACTSRO_11325 [Candidatus Heimdallarchaeaceae archaeon]
MLETNFSNNEGYPITTQLASNTSSELIILSSLVYSMLNQTGYLNEEKSVLDKQLLIERTIFNKSFVDFYNNSEKLTISSQVLGLYSLLQVYFATKSITASIDLFFILEILNKFLENYYSPKLQMIIPQTSNISFFEDQALTVWFLATLKLVSGTINVYEYHTVSIIQNLLDSISTYFFNSTTSMFHSSYNCSSGESFGEVTVEELIYFCIALSRIEKFYYDYIYFPRSSLNIHQKIVSDYLDKNWVLHTNNKSDSEMKIKNQAYLGLISYLMNLDTIGENIRNSTILNFLKEEGFSEKVLSEDITCESNLYGLMTVLSEKWSGIQNERENYEYGPSAQSRIGVEIYLSFMLVVIMSKLRKKGKKKRRMVFNSRR